MSSIKRKPTVRLLNHKVYGELLQIGSYAYTNAALTPSNVKIIMEYYLRD